MGDTTDRLVESLAAAARGERETARRTLARLEDDTLATVREFFGKGADAVASLVKPELAELGRMADAVAVLRSVPAAGRDHFLAQGERISAAVVSEALRARGLPAEHLDAREVMATDDHFGRARPDLPRIRRLIGERLRSRGAAPAIRVTEGFIGRAPGGQTTTLGRGGSDYSAALLAAALEASAVEIWTDVSGMMTADPRVVPQARVIPAISFEEASELAYFGARVLHPLTLAPAVEKGIPVRIRNSREPEEPGTEVRTSAPPGPSRVRSIAFKKGIATVDMHTSRMLMEAGFLKTLFEVFARHETPVDMVSTSEVSVSVTVDDVSRLSDIRQDLEALAEVEVGQDRAIVCLVGQDLKFAPGLAARIFRAVEQINILMISQGASRRNVSFVVEEKDVEEAVRALHREFFER
jgi:aspartate kinase